MIKLSNKHIFNFVLIYFNPVELFLFYLTLMNKKNNNKIPKIWILRIYTHALTASTI